MDTARVAEVYASHATERSYGSGYLIAPALVLTARHVVAPALAGGADRGSCELRLIGDVSAGRVDWRNCDIVWDDAGLDLALLRVRAGKVADTDTDSDTDAPPALVPMALLPRTEVQPACRAIGFPRVQRHDERNQTQEVSGVVLTGSMLAARLWQVAVTTGVAPRDDADWKGVSGAALFCADQLVGVITDAESRFREGVLVAQPIDPLADDAGFLQALGQSREAAFKPYQSAPHTVAADPKPWAALGRLIYLVDRKIAVAELKTAVVRTQKTPNAPRTFACAVPGAVEHEHIDLIELFRRQTWPALFPGRPGFDAILLGQPLLLTGEPGTGKTQFAYALAKALNLGPVHECFVKSTTSARDLFYSFDELARFRDNQAGEPQPLQRYLSFNGLGRAILFAGGRDHPLERLPGLAFETAPSTALGLQKGPAPRAARPQRLGDLYPTAAFPDAPAASLVLIDELDKAPRDTPNDMLNEIERLGFDIPELGVRVAVPGDPKTRPVIVITSNSEKSLPEPFLRRCVYHDIPFPGAALREIVYAQVKGLQAKEGGDGAALTGVLLTDALALFDRLRDRSRIQRPPGTAELLSWIDTLLGAGLPPGVPLRAPLAVALEEVMALATQAAVLGEAPGVSGSAPNLVESLLAVLVKKAEDRSAALDVIRQWVQQTD